MADRLSMPALYPLLRRAKTALLSFLLVAPLMIIALSAADATWAQDRATRAAADETLRGVSGFQARLKALERQAAMFKPDGVPVRAKVSATRKGAKVSTSRKPMPQTKEHILLGRQISSHSAAIRKLKARVDAFEKEARGHEMGHNLDMPPAMAAKSKRLDRDIGTLERDARAIYKKPGRTK